MDETRSMLFTLIAFFWFFIFIKGVATYAQMVLQESEVAQGPRDGWLNFL